MATVSSRNTSKTDAAKADTGSGDLSSNPETSGEKADSKTDNSKSTGTRYLNTTSGPVVYDKEGRQVDAADWTPEITLDAVGKAARQAGHLLPPSAL